MIKISKNTLFGLNSPNNRLSQQSFNHETSIYILNIHLLIYYFLVFNSIPNSFLIFDLKYLEFNAKFIYNFFEVNLLRILK